MTIDLWDNLQSIDPIPEHVSQVRVATAYLWPVLAQATDRQDFENRWAVVEPNVRREAQKVSDDPSIPLRVRAAYAQDYLTVEANRPPVTAPPKVISPRWASLDKEATLFTRHHYNLVAHILHAYQQQNGPVEGLADSFGSALARENPNFDPQRFGSAVQNGVPTVNFTAPMRSAHFNLLASSIASAPPEHREQLAKHFATALQATNPEFRRERFIQAANPVAPTIKVGSFEIDSFGGIRVIADDNDSILHGPRCNAGSAWITSGDRGKYCQSCHHAWDPNDVEEMGPALSYSGSRKQAARLSEPEARQIAYEWHGGQSSPLYSFASSGYLHPRLEQEIGQNMRAPGPPDVEDHKEDLRALKEHVEARRPSGWNDMDSEDQEDWARHEHRSANPHRYRQTAQRQRQRQTSQPLDNGVQLIRDSSGKLLRVASSHDPIAYTYETDFHCPNCAEDRFGRDEHGDISGEDREGNEVYPVFPWDETPPGTECASCGREITPDDPGYDHKNQSWKTAGHTNATQLTLPKRSVGKQLKRLVSRRPKMAADWDSMPNNPFTPSTNQGNLQGNSDLPSGSADPYSPSAGGAIPAMSSSDPGLSGSQDEQLPANMRNQARQRKIDAIADDLRYANPGVTASQAISLATQTVDRYPYLVVEARGGADYIPNQMLTKCPQCKKRAFSTDSGTCHNCGFVDLTE